MKDADRYNQSQKEDHVETKYIIRFGRHQFCNCFSERDLLTNLKFVIREGLKILSVEAV